MWRALLPSLSYVLGLFFGARLAFATSTGIAGYSGKTPRQICSVCHSRGSAPVVGFDGPTSLNPNDSGTFTFSVMSTNPDVQTYAGLDVAASAGTLSAISGQGTKVLSLEITHTGPKHNDANGLATFSFKWKAPAAAGNYTLYGAGNSVNHNGTTDGDAPSAAVWFVAVGNVTPFPTYTVTAAPVSPTTTATHSVTPTMTPTHTPTASPSPTVDASNTSTPTTMPSATATSSSLPSESPTDFPTPTKSFTPLETSTATETVAPQPTATAFATLTPTATASTSATATLSPTPALNGDANCDAAFTAADLTGLILQIGQTPTCGADLTGDGQLTLDDAEALERLIFDGP